MLKNPLEQKYKKSKEASNIYELFEESEGSVPIEELERNKQWIKNHIFHLENVDFSKKDFLRQSIQISREKKEDICFPIFIIIMIIMWR